MSRLALAFGRDGALDGAHTDAGGDIDECGDSDVWGPLAWNDCQLDITVEPTTCP